MRFRRLRIIPPLIYSLLFLACVVLAIRSHWRQDTFAVWDFKDSMPGPRKPDQRNPASPLTYLIRSNAGVLSFEYINAEWKTQIYGQFNNQKRVELDFDSSRSDPTFRFSQSLPRLISIGYENLHRPETVGIPPPSTKPTADGFFPAYSISPQQHLIRFWIPWWIFLLATLIPVPFFLRARRRRLNNERGLCRHCGYDLRASPERCPECGRSVR